MDNKLRFDPMTGEPINQDNNVQPLQPQTNLEQQQIYQQVQPQQQGYEQVQTQQPLVQQQAYQQIKPQTVPNINQANSNNAIQQQMQTIPTVDQSRQEFVNNTQTSSDIKKEDKKDNSNIVFIVILFLIIFSAIFFLFPYLLNIL